MDYEFLVHVFQTPGYLLNYFGCLFFWQFFLLFYLLEAAIREQFHDQIEVVFVMEETVEGSEVFIGQVSLQFYFPDNVFLNFSLFYPFFGHFL